MLPSVAAMVSLVAVGSGLGCSPCLRLQSMLSVVAVHVVCGSSLCCVW